MPTVSRGTVFRRTIAVDPARGNSNTPPTPPDPLRLANALVRQVGTEHGLRTILLDDGERVIPLRGRIQGKHKSDRAHAARWSHDCWYVLIPCATANRRTRILQRRFPELVVRSSEAEVLVLGPQDLILRVLMEGPTWARGRARRALSEERRAALAELGARHRFGKKAGMRA